MSATVLDHRPASLPSQQRYGSVNLMATVLVLATIWAAPYGLWQVDDASWEAGPVLAVVVIGTGIVVIIAGALLASRRVATRYAPISAGRISPICPTSSQSA